MKKIIPYLLITLFMLIIWQFLSRISGIFRLNFSSPFLQLEYWRSEFGLIIKSFGYTSVEALVGFLIAIFISLNVGILFAFKPKRALLIYPLLVFSQIIPIVCFAPVIIMIFGVGPSGKMILSAIMCFFPIVASIVVGLKNIRKEAFDYMKLSNASQKDIAKHVIIPSCTPHFLGGLRVAAPFSVVGAVVAEFNGAEFGLGKDIYIATKRLEPEVFVGAIISCAILATIIYGIVVLFEKIIRKRYLGDRTNESI